MRDLRSVMTATGLCLAVSGCGLVLDLDPEPVTRPADAAWVTGDGGATVPPDAGRRRDAATVSPLDGSVRPEDGGGGNLDGAARSRDGATGAPDGRTPLGPGVPCTSDAECESGVCLGAADATDACRYACSATCDEKADCTPLMSILGVRVTIHCVGGVCRIAAWTGSECI